MNSLIKAASGSYIGKNDRANNFDDSIAASGSSMKKLNSQIISMIAVRSACVSKDRFYTFYYLVPVALKCPLVSKVILLMIIFCLKIMNRSMKILLDSINYIDFI